MKFGLVKLLAKEDNREDIAIIEDDEGNELLKYASDIRAKIRQMGYSCHCDLFICRSEPWPSIAMQYCPASLRDWPIKKWIKSLICKVLN